MYASSRGVSQVVHVPDGLEAVVFSADGDMRQALNNLQSTVAGFGVVNQENVFKVCDQPHPLLVGQIVENCIRTDMDKAEEGLKALWDLGYSAMDIITTIFRVVRNYSAEEFLKLNLIKEVGKCHVRITNGVDSRLQLSGLLANMCLLADKAPKS